MSDKSVVTMAVLNDAYQDLYKRLISIDSPWNILGNKTWADFWVLTSSNEGETWNISDISGMPSSIKDVKEGSNLTCLKTYSGVTLTIDNWRSYWWVTSGVNDIAQDTKAGLIKTRPSSVDTEGSTADTSAKRGVHLDSNNQAYVDIPMATTSGYGLINTKDQSFSGKKTFTNDIVVNGKITGEVEGVASKVKVTKISTTSTPLQTTEIKVIGGLEDSEGADAHNLYDNGIKMQVQTSGFKISGGLTSKALNITDDVIISKNTNISANTFISAQTTISNPLNVKGTMVLGTDGKTTTLTSEAANGSLNIEGTNVVKGGSGLTIINDASSASSLSVSGSNTLGSSNITNTTISGNKGLTIKGSSTRAGSLNVIGTTVNIGTDNKTTTITSTAENGALNIEASTTLQGGKGLIIKNSDSTTNTSILDINGPGVVSLQAGNGLTIKNSNSTSSVTADINGVNINVNNPVSINGNLTISSNTSIGDSNKGAVTIKSGGSGSTTIIGPSNGTINLPLNSSADSVALVQASAGSSSWLSYTNTNTANTLVKRDGSGNFSAGTITANLSGTATQVSNGLTINNGATAAISDWKGNISKTLSIKGTSPIISTAATDSIDLSHATSGPSTTAATSKGDLIDQTPNFGGTFKTLSATVDKYGHTTSLEEHTVKIPSLTASNDGEGRGTIGSIKINGAPTTFKHPKVNITSTTSDTSPGYGNTFTAIDSIEKDNDGHITKVNTKTVTMPSAQTINDATVTVTLNGSSAQSFTLNQSESTTIDIVDTTYKGTTTSSTSGCVSFVAYNGSTSIGTIISQVQGLGSLAYSSDVTNKKSTIIPGDDAETTIATVADIPITLKVSNNFNATSSTTATNSDNIKISSTTSQVYLVGVNSTSGYNEAQTSSLVCMTDGELTASKVKNAVWNDLIDCIEVPESTKLDFGYAYGFDGKNYNKTSKKADPSYIGIHSDTYGMMMGIKKDKKVLNAAVAGFVLAYVDKIYKAGTPLTTSANGELTKASLLTRILHPERIIGTFWKEEEAIYWGEEDKKVEVRGRNWIKIK